ncbi:hypothetical protein AB6F61_13190 [Providencia hangzhouensis]
MERDTNGSARISYIGESIDSNTEQIYLISNQYHQKIIVLRMNYR